MKITKKDKDRIVREKMSEYGKASQRVQFGDMSDEEKSAYFKDLAEKATKARKKRAKNKSRTSDLTPL